MCVDRRHGGRLSPSDLPPPCGRTRGKLRRRCGRGRRGGPRRPPGQLDQGAVTRDVQAPESFVEHNPPACTAGRTQTSRSRSGAPAPLSACPESRAIEPRARAPGGSRRQPVKTRPSSRRLRREEGAGRPGCRSGGGALPGGWASGQLFIGANGEAGRSARRRQLRERGRVRSVTAGDRGSGPGSPLALEGDPSADSSIHQAIPETTRDCRAATGRVPRRWSRPRPVDSYGECSACAVAEAGNGAPLGFREGRAVLDHFGAGADSFWAFDLNLKERAW